MEKYQSQKPKLENQSSSINSILAQFEKLEKKQVKQQKPSKVRITEVDLPKLNV